MRSVIDQAVCNPTFREALLRDPLALARTAGYDVSADQVAGLLGIKADSQEILQQLLAIRLSQLAAGMWS